MTYYGAKELAQSFRTVRNNTLIIAQEIPEEKYGFRPTPESKSVAELLAHIALNTRLAEQMHFSPKLSTLEAFDFMKAFGPIAAEMAKPRTKAELIALLKEEGERYASQLEKLSDADLGVVLKMPPMGEPPTRSRFDMLLGVKEHEMHHRAQLMLIERLIGITPHLTRRMQERMAAAQQQAASQK